MSMLKAKLYQLEMEKPKQQSLRGEQMEMAGAHKSVLTCSIRIQWSRPSDK